MKKQNRFHMLGHLLLALFLIAQIISFIVYFEYGKIFWLKIIAIVFWVGSIYFGWGTVYVFKKKGGVKKGESFVKTTKLVDIGNYSIVRHPQFLGGILLSLAFMLFSQHWLVILLGIPPIIMWYIGGIEEEKLGLKKFGKKYEDYKKRVPRFNLFLGLWRKLREKK